MNNFYGGLPGKDFKIAHIFDTVSGSTNSLVADINAGLNSPYAVGDYVFVSYGLPGGDLNEEDKITGYGPYDQNRKIDEDNLKAAYNATLWQKIYAGEDVTDYSWNKPTIIFQSATVAQGYGYQLIASFTGNTPKISVETELLNAGEPAITEIDNTNPDYPVFTFSFPKGQKIVYTGKEVLDADEEPAVTWIDSIDQVWEDGENKLNKPELKFHLPQSQILQLGETTVLDAGELPATHLDETNINRPILSFDLPQSQKINYLGKETLNADLEPEVVYDDTTDVNNPTLKFKLPQSQRLKLGETTILDADQEPSANLNDLGHNINEPVISFNLPQSQVFNSEILVETIGQDDTPIASLVGSDEENYSVNSPQIKLQIPVPREINVNTTTLDPDDNFFAVVIKDPIKNELTIEFGMPRGQSIWYGELGKQGEDFEPNILEVNTAWGSNDTYINIPHGYIYKMQKIGESSTLINKFIYQGQISIPVQTEKDTNDSTDLTYSTGYVNGLEEKLQEGIANVRIYWSDF